MTPPSSDDCGVPMDRRRFLKITSLAGSAFAASGILGTLGGGTARGNELALERSVRLPLPGTSVDFAIVGDFGAGNYGRDGQPLPHNGVNPDCLAVAEGIKSHAPVHGSAYIISVGDQIYIPFEASPQSETIQANVASYDTAIGQLFYPYIRFPANSTSKYKNKGSRTQRFFCLLGDHDWWHQPRVSVSGFINYNPDSLAFPQYPATQTHYLLEQSGQGSAFMDYFSEQGLWSTTQNPRYYDLLQGDIHWFALSSDPNETLFDTLSNAYNYTGEITSGVTAGQDNLQNSTQGQWLTGALEASTSPWKIVMMHNPPFVSSQPGSPYDGHYPAAYMQWDYDQLGVDAVISGHAHAYERLYVNDCTYIVCGSGGTFESLSTFIDPPDPGSIVRVENRFGFMTGKVTPQKLELLYVVVNSKDKPGPRETLDRCILLKNGTLVPEDKPSLATSIIVTTGGGAINTPATVTLLSGALLGPGIFTKDGVGTLVLTGANAFTGTLVASKGAVRLGSDQTLDSTSTLQLVGGKVDAMDVTQSYETPLIVQGISQLELNESSQMAFADSSATDWLGGQLVLQGTLGAQSLRFGTSPGGLTAAQCAQILIGTPKGPSIQLDVNGYVLPLAAG